MSGCTNNYISDETHQNSSQECIWNYSLFGLESDYWQLRQNNDSIREYDGILELSNSTQEHSLSKSYEEDKQVLDTQDISKQFCDWRQNTTSYPSVKTKSQCNSPCESEVRIQQNKWKSDIKSNKRTGDIVLPFSSPKDECSLGSKTLESSPVQICRAKPVSLSFEDEHTSPIAWLNLEIISNDKGIIYLLDKDDLTLLFSRLGQAESITIDTSKTKAKVVMKSQSDFKKSYSYLNNYNLPLFNAYLTLK